MGEELDEEEDSEARERVSLIVGGREKGEWIGGWDPQGNTKVNRVKRK